MKNVYGKLILGLAIVVATHAGASSAPESFTYQGKVFKANGVDPVDAQSVLFKVQIRSADGTCMLFEETHLRDMSASGGLFSLVIGEGTNTNATNLNLSQVFDNSVAKSGASSCAYTPAAGDGRRLRFSYFDGVQIVSIPVDQNLRSVPYAINASTLAGLTKNKIIQTSATTTQSEVDALTAGTSAHYSKTADLPVSGGFLNMSATGVKVADVPPTADSAVNRNYTDSRLGGMDLALAGLQDGQVLSWNSSQSKWKAVNPNIGGSTSITTTGTVTAANIVANVNITGATIISTGNVNAVNVNASADVNAVNMNASGNVSASNISATTGSLQVLRLFDTTNTRKVTMSVPLGMAQDYSLVLPNAKGLLGQVLTTDASGNLSWTTPTVGTVTSVGVSAPLVSSGGATPSLSLAKADATHDGYVAAADFLTFKNKMTSSLANGQIWIGNASDAATPVAISGDVSLTNAGAFTVNKIQGQNLNFAGAASGAFMKYDGTNWTPVTIKLQDIKSTIAGNVFASANCTASESLTWSSITDAFSCQAIQTGSASQKGLLAVGGGLTVSSGTISVDTGTTANKIVKLDSSGKLPAMDASALVNVPTSGFANMQVFNANGTFAVPAGVTKVYVQMWGGGGAGSPGILTAGGVGGGGGAYAGEIMAVTPGANMSVVVGAGGAVGNNLQSGGAGGASMFGTLSAGGGAGGPMIGGIALGGTSTSDTAVAGQRGALGLSLAVVTTGGDGGAAGGAGGAGGRGSNASGVVGNAGAVPGGGGGGGAVTAVITASLGGVGGAGRVIVWY